MPDSPDSFTRSFLREMFWRIGLAVIAMLLSFVGAELAGSFDSEWGRFFGAVAGLAVGLAVMVAVLRRRG